jgi:hypothetical protein
MSSGNARIDLLIAQGFHRIARAPLRRHDKRFFSFRGFLDQKNKRVLFVENKKDRNLRSKSEALEREYR